MQDIDIENFTIPQTTQETAADMKDWFSLLNFGRFLNGSLLAERHGRSASMIDMVFSTIDASDIEGYKTTSNVGWMLNVEILI